MRVMRGTGTEQTIGPRCFVVAVVPQWIRPWRRSGLVALLVSFLTFLGRSPGSSTRTYGCQILIQSSGGETGTRTCHCCSPALASTNSFRPSTG